MHKRRNVLVTGLVVLLLVLFLAPAAVFMKPESEAFSDAEHLIEPMLRLMAAAPASAANIPVEPMIDIEAAWAIEDTREEAWEPLVAGMRNGSDELGFDAESITFYCTLGMELGDSWPQIDLFAEAAGGDENLRVAWIDDYSYDFPADSIRDGWRYELLAYTDTQYQYIGLVFTGLPIVRLAVEAGTEIAQEYVPAYLSLSAAGYEPVHSGVWVHTRGGGYDKGLDKHSYRVEFHEQTGGQDKKRSVGLLGMEPDTDWLLISNASDETGMRNHLSWELWNRWNPDGDAPVLLESRMVEVFVGDEYKGLYQIMQRIREEEEMIRLGGNPDTDYLYRIIREMGIDSRPVQMRDLRFYELRLKPEGVSQKRQFDRIENYVLLNQVDPALDEETFSALAQACVDIPALMNYYAFSQAADLGYENVDNNVYIWAIRGEDGAYRYHLSPWDMDNALPNGQGTPEEQAGLNLMMRMPYQILNLDVMGSRDIYYAIWAEKRADILTDDALYQWFDAWETYINDSGAYLRETETWWGGARELNLQGICANMIDSMHNMDRQMRELWPVEEDGMLP
ncbi:MAG: CotH kinase family protein [Clostridia bacterium]|nr:CotH kinase family protein [Clostridia bacterium]